MDAATEQLHRERQAAQRQGFGQRIKDAVQQRRMSGSYAPRADGEQSFGQKLRDAVGKKSGRKQHEEQAERDCNRYRKLRPRPHTVSE